MTTRAARAARGWLVALFATLAAAVSHGLAGGEFPGIFGLLASLVLAGAASSVLTARRQSAWRLAAAVAITQVLYHAVFSGMGDPSAIARREHHSVVLDAASIHDHAVGMWWAHVAAGLLTFAVLRHAESALWNLGRTLGILVARLLAVVVPVAAAGAETRRTEPGTAATPLHFLIARSSLRYRGPPVGPRVA